MHCAMMSDQKSRSTDLTLILYFHNSEIIYITEQVFSKAFSFKFANLYKDGHLVYVAIPDL